MTAEIDVASLQKSLPGVLPVRTDTEILSGKITLRTDSLPSGPSKRRRFELNTDEIRALSKDDVVLAIQPIELFAILSNHDGVLGVEKFHCESEFANVIGSGDLRHGEVEVNAELGLFSEKLIAITDMTGLEFDGSVESRLRWDLEPGGPGAGGPGAGDLEPGHEWRLVGSGSASNVSLTRNGIKTIHQNRLDGKIDFLGHWGSQCLEALSLARLSLKGDELDLQAELARPVQDLSRESPLPLRVKATGRIENLAGLLQSWTQMQVREAEGQFDLNLEGELSAVSGRLDKATLEVSQPRVAYENHWLGQSKLNVDFDGEWAWPSGDFEAKSLKARCDAIVAELRGRIGPKSIDCAVAWRAKLDQITNSFHEPVAGQPASGLRESIIWPATSRSRLTRASKDWQLQGGCSGRLDVRGDAEIIEVRGSVSGTELVLRERLPTAADGSNELLAISMMRSVTALDEESTSNPVTAENPHRLIWKEPEVKLTGSLSYDPSTQLAVIDSVKVAGDWFATALSGEAIWNSQRGDLSLDGPLTVKLPELGKHLTELAGTEVDVRGTHVAPLKIQLHRQEDGSTALAVDGTLGWESGEVVGVKFGPASIPVRLSETRLQVASSVIPAGDGKIRLAGEVQYRSGPITIRLQPGVVAESILLTEEMTDRWLKFIAPPMMRVEKIHGTVGAELDESIIVIGAPDQTHVAGRVKIQKVEMSYTPFMQQVMDTLERLRDIVDGPAGVHRVRTDNLITMPAQNIDFDLNLGLVDHKRIEIVIDKTPIIFSGYVTLDGRLAMIAKVPASYLERHLSSQDASGKFISLPISGTTNYPLVNPTGLANVATLLTDRTAFDVGEELIRQQLEHDKVLYEDTKTLLLDGKKLLESTQIIEDGLQRILDRADERRQSKNSKEPASTVR